MAHSKEKIADSGAVELAATSDVSLCVKDASRERSSHRIRLQVNRIEAPVTAKAYMACAFAAFGGLSHLHKRDCNPCSPATFQAFSLATTQDTLSVVIRFTISAITEPLPQNGVTGSGVFIRLIEGQNATKLSPSDNSLIVSILSAGTFFGMSCPFAVFCCDW